MHDELLGALRRIVGPANVLVGDDKASYETDWRGQVHGSALAVVRPGSVEQTRAVVQQCADRHVAIVPQGGNTGLAAGATPDASGSQVILSLRRLTAIRKVDRANMTVTVEAGCTLQGLRESLMAQGLLFPLSLGSEGTCTIGGNLATNAGGAQALRFGNARDLCLGLEFLTADGELVSELGGLRKNNTGFDLKGLIIGSEGSLGIITAATLKIEHAPASSVCAWMGLRNVDSAVALLRRCQASLGTELTSFEIMNRASLELAADAFPGMPIPFLDNKDVEQFALMQLDSQAPHETLQARIEQALGAAMDDAELIDASISDSMQRAKSFWLIRENIVLAQARKPQVVNFDISVPISAVNRFLVLSARKIEERHGALPIVCFGHLGDGNLHFSVHTSRLHEAAVTPNIEDDLRDELYRIVLDLEGSFSAEHGIGARKTSHLRKYKAGARLRMMQRIKQALDPRNLLNPGKVVQPD